MPNNNQSEWMKRSSIDYFPPFISLWLACNSWYQSHYSEIGNKDRDCINKLKTDYTPRNHLYRKYCELITKEDKSGIAFRTNIELLHYSLVRANLISKIGLCSLEEAVIDFNHKEKKTKLIVTPRRNKSGSIKSVDVATLIELDSICITNDHEKFFAGLLEIIYQVRNMLVHGNLNPDKDEHEVVKYCYLILWSLMN